MRIRLPHVALAGVLAIGLTGGAVAAIPSANGTISACMTTADGKLRIVDGDVPAGRTCLPGEKPLSWNQTGPPGPAGPSFARVLEHPGEFIGERAGHQKQVGIVTLAPGTHHVLTAGARAQRPQPGQLNTIGAGCAIYAAPAGSSGWGQDVASDNARWTYDEDAPQRLSMRGYLSTTQWTTVRFVCQADSQSRHGGASQDYTSVSEMQLEALQIGGYDRKVTQ